MAGAADDEGLAATGSHPRDPFRWLRPPFEVRSLSARMRCTSIWSRDSHSSQASARSRWTSSDRSLQMRGGSSVEDCRGGVPCQGDAAPLRYQWRLQGIPSNVRNGFILSWAGALRVQVNGPESGQLASRRASRHDCPMPRPPTRRRRFCLTGRRCRDLPAGNDLAAITSQAWRTRGGSATGWLCGLPAVSSHAGMRAGR